MNARRTSGDYDFEPDYETFLNFSKTGNISLKACNSNGCSNPIDDIYVEYFTGGNCG